MTNRTTICHLVSWHLHLALSIVVLCIFVIFSFLKSFMTQNISFFIQRTFHSLMHTFSVMFNSSHIQCPCKCAQFLSDIKTATFHKSHLVSHFDIQCKQASDFDECWPLTDGLFYKSAIDKEYETCAFSTKKFLFSGVIRIWRHFVIYTEEWKDDFIMEFIKCSVGIFPKLSTMGCGRFWSSDYAHFYVILTHFFLMKFTNFGYFWFAAELSTRRFKKMYADEFDSWYVFTITFLHFFYNFTIIFFDVASCIR